MYLCFVFVYVFKFRTLLRTISEKLCTQGADIFKEKSKLNAVCLHVTTILIVGNGVISKK